MYEHEDIPTDLPNDGNSTNIDWDDTDSLLTYGDSDDDEDYIGLFRPLVVYPATDLGELGAMRRDYMDVVWRGDWRPEPRIERFIERWDLWHGLKREDPAKGKHERVPDHFAKPKKPKRERPLKVEGLSAYDPTHGYSKRAEGRRKKQFKNKGRGGGGKKNCNVVR